MTSRMEGHFFMYKDYEKDIFLWFVLSFRTPAPPHAARRVYHQFRRNCISPTACRCISSSRREIQPRRGWWDTRAHCALDDIHDCVAMLCQACGLDKKFDKSKLVDFLDFAEDSMKLGYSPECEYFSLCRWWASSPTAFAQIRTHCCAVGTTTGCEQTSSAAKNRKNRPIGSVYSWQRN